MNNKKQNCPFESPTNIEETQIKELNDITVKLLDSRYEKATPMLRGVHPKAHGCVEATFTINPNLDKDLQVGLFSHPGHVHKSVIRFSNAAARVAPDIIDGKHGSRGMAVKVFGVTGDVLLEDKDSKNQDFLMINQPAFVFANTEDYLRLNQVLLEDGDIPERFFEDVPKLLKKLKESPQDLTANEIRILESAKIIGGIQKTPEDDDAHPLEIQYFSAAPFLFGENKVMKFSAKPVINKTKTKFPDQPGPDYLSDALSKSMGDDGQDFEFQFLVQIRDCSDGLGIENASTVWDQTKYEFREVAKIIIPTPQKTMLDETHQLYCENLEYNPWHSLKAHKPLGSINRLRKSVYLSSASHRLKSNSK